MPHNFTGQGIVFSVKPLGESNSSVCFLIKDSGIVYATLYGGPKSRLKALVSPWNSGTVYLYCKENDDMTRGVKIVDFDVKNYHLSFRESLYKTYAASLGAELIMKTKCAGSYERAWVLFSGLIDGLELCSGQECEAGTVRFLWRYLGLLGIRPDASRCAGCGKEFFTGNSDADEVSYDISENGFMCRACASREQAASQFSLSAEAVRYLYAVSELTPAEVRALPLSSGALSDMKRLVFFLSEQAAGVRLKTLASGMGIL